jgi:hypothetical protein
VDFEQTLRAPQGFLKREVTIDIAVDDADLVACFTITLDAAEDPRSREHEPEEWSFYSEGSGANAFWIRRDLFDEASWDEPGRLVIRQPPIEITIGREDPDGSSDD